MSHYSSALLRSLRNQIPIEKVITHMNMEIKPGGKWLRFRCPLCHNCNTATNSKTNLARCFNCKMNFNPIDMVMAVGNVCFTEAVEFLMQHLQVS
ncbi:MAG: hypothetical protein C4519_11385 [Desulfobacteraceae bacterium]|nr:MAG: hypothetical protein C4519_11385 [Desulfobacteraceae bacterium]